MRKSLRDVLLAQREERLRIVVHTTNGDSISGDIAGIGEDYVTIRHNAQDRIISTLPFDHIVRITLYPQPGEPYLKDGETEDE